MPGRFYVIDGPDGSGKTTQVGRLARSLTERGHKVLVLREPGATPVGETIRDMLLDPDTDVTPLAEMLLYQAARAQIVDAVVRPALREGTTVLLDRYCYSTAAYQGAGLGLDTDEIHRVSATATGGLEPDHAVFLDIDPEVAFSRLDGARDRIEGRPLDYHRRVREGFLMVAELLGARATVIDAAQDADTVALTIRAALGDG